MLHQGGEVEVIVEGKLGRCNHDMSSGSQTQGRSNFHFSTWSGNTLCCIFSRNTITNVCEYVPRGPTPLVLVDKIINRVVPYCFVYLFNFSLIYPTDEVMGREAGKRGPL